MRAFCTGTSNAPWAWVIYEGPCKKYCQKLSRTCLLINTKGGCMERIPNPDDSIKVENFGDVEMGNE